MIFDIGLFGGGEESNSFTQERFTDHEGEDVSVYLYLGIWGTNGKYLVHAREIHRPRERDNL